MFLLSTPCSGAGLGRFSDGRAKPLRCPTESGKRSSVGGRDQCQRTSPESQHQLFACLGVVAPCTGKEESILPLGFAGSCVWCSSPCCAFMLSRTACRTIRPLGALSILWLTSRQLLPAAALLSREQTVRSAEREDYSYWDAWIVRDSQMPEH